MPSTAGVCGPTVPVCVRTNHNSAVGDGGDGEEVMAAAAVWSPAVRGSLMPLSCLGAASIELISK